MFTLAKGQNNNAIAWTKVPEGFVQAKFNTQGQQALTLPGVPSEARVALVDIFMTNSAKDHYNIDLGRDKNSDSRYTSWVAGGGQPSSSFPAQVETDQGIHQTYFGDADGHSSYYGIWYSSLIITTDGATTYHRKSLHEQAWLDCWVG